MEATFRKEYTEQIDRERRPSGKNIEIIGRSNLYM